MLSKYEIEHVILAEKYTKSRKIITLNQMIPESPADQQLINEIKKEILGSETEESVLARFQDEESDQWVDFYSRRAASDLLTLGKVEPEVMLAMSALPIDDFVKSVKKATEIARKLNNLTIEAESEISDNLIPEELV